MFFVQTVSPLSWKLGQNILTHCAAKLEPYLPPAVKFMGIDLSDFAEIVFSICQDASGSEHLVRFSLFESSVYSGEIEMTSLQLIIFHQKNSHKMFVLVSVV